MFLAEIGKEGRELRATFLTRQISLFVIWLIAPLYRGKNYLGDKKNSNDKRLDKI